MFIFLVPYALAVLILICTLAKRSAIRRAAVAAEAAQEQARREAEAAQAQARRIAQEKAAREQARREAEAAAKKAAAEQKRKERAAEAAAKKAAAEEKRQERAARAEEEHALKLARAAELAELAERRLQAEKELAELRKAATQTNENHFEQEQPAQEQAEKPEAPVLTLNQFTQAAAPAPQPFRGQTVAFTGRLTVSGMTRAQAIEKVKQAGGNAYKDMTSYTTLLVVGENPGMKKLDKADKWIEQVRKITERQFLEMLEAA